MINQPRSPNIFDAVHLTAAKQPSPQTQDFSQNTFYFNKKLESITQFLDFLECNPENHTELTELELRWERSFFKNELKAALFLNYTLIKIHCQMNDELKQLKIDVKSRSEKKKLCQEFESKLEWHTESSENCQDNSNGTTPLKKRLVREAFDAEKKILQAKHQRQCDELKKAIQHKEQMLRVSKQENQYIRGELLEISEKNFTLLNDNRALEDSKRKIENQYKELKTKLQQLEQREKIQNHEIRLNQLNCSPINRSSDTFGLEQGEISFNHEFFNENMIQNRLLKKQIQDIQFELDEAKEQNFRLLANNNHQNDQHMDVMQQSCRLFLVELEKQYLDVKRQLQECVLEIGKYKKIIHEMEEKSTKALLKQAEKHDISAAHKDSCLNCLTLQKDCEVLKTEKQKIQAKYQTLRQKFDKTLNLELVQRQQWDNFLKDLKASPSE